MSTDPAAPPADDTPPRVALVYLSTPDATPLAAARVFGALAITDVRELLNERNAEGRWFRGRLGAITVDVSRREPGEFLHDDYPIGVLIDAGATAAADPHALADMAAFELLRAAFGVIEMLPRQGDGIARWREFVMDRHGRLQSLVLEGPLED